MVGSKPSKMKTGFEDLRQSDEWSRYISQLGWRVEKLGKAKVFVRKLPLIGAVVKIQRPREVPPIEEIDKVARKYRALFVKLEPACRPRQHKMLRLQGIGKQFEPDTWTLLPTRTIYLDLTTGEEEIFASFSKDARYSVRRAQKLGVVVVCKAWPFGDLHIFHQFLRETGKRKKFYVAPFKHLKAKVGAFKNNSALILAYHKEQVVAGALILFHDRVAYYHHAAASPKGRELLAGYPIVWEAIKLAKKRGCHTFDLEGIYDSRYKVCRRLKTLSVFKRKFGGEEITFPGSFVKYYNPIVRLAFKIASWG